MNKTKYHTPKVKGEIVYLTQSMYSFCTIIDRLQGKEAHERGATIHSHGR